MSVRIYKKKRVFEVEYNNHDHVNHDHATFI